MRICFNLRTSAVLFQKSVQKRVSFAATCMAGGLMLSVCAHPVSAAIITYIGEDLILTANPPAVHPNSSAAAANFDAAVAGIGGASIITFEGAPVGSFSNLTVAPGVSISGTDANGANQQILNATNSPSYPSAVGFNTTSGGNAFVAIQGGTLTFTFATPVQFFGAYLSGVQTSYFPDKLVFSDGTSQSITPAGVGTSTNVAELAFIGFTDTGKLISSITINTGSFSTGADFIGIDDVRIPTSTPEPSSWALMLIGCAGIGLSRQRRQKHRHVK